jgi:4-hydroxy-tetrahydrodipicolinate synthase
MHGVILPLITPFHERSVDLQSFDRLLDHYLNSGITGLLLLGTTGESPTVTLEERDELIARAISIVDHRINVFVGVTGNATDSVVTTIHNLERFDIDGYLLVCPYYIRPPQDGIAAHFRTAAAATERTIIVYNIPYRTGVNLENSTLLELVDACPNIRAVKDSCGNLAQTVDLISRAPNGFSVLTGEDHQFFTAVANGADGGILASAHLATTTFVDIEQALRNDDLATARSAWGSIGAPVARMLFRGAEPDAC